MLAALGAAFQRFRDPRPALQRATFDVLVVAILEAQRRGRGPVAAAHFALALLGDPTVAQLLVDRKVSTHALADDLERLLSAVPSAREAKDDGAATIAALFEHARGGGAPIDPAQLLGALLRPEHQAIRAAFARHGVTADDWSEALLHRESTTYSPSSGGDPDAGPYRSVPSKNVDVVLWNDDQTTMEFVVELLRGTFGVVEPEASMMMVTTHRDGCVVIGTYARAEAERLVDSALRAAKDRGFPLRVTVETPAERAPTSLLGRWVQRRRARSLVRVDVQRLARAASSTAAPHSPALSHTCPHCGTSGPHRPLEEAVVCVTCGRSFDAQGTVI